MLSSFICGSGSFHKDDDDEPSTKTPKRSPRKNSFCRRLSSKNIIKNSYSFSDLMAAVRLKKDQNKISKGRHSMTKGEPRRPVQEVVKEPAAALEKEPKRVGKMGFSWNAEAWRPSFYLPAAVILILVFLPVFGRSAAVMCTSIGWYLVPVLEGERSNYGKRSMKKKELGRRPSEKKMVVKSL